MCGVVAFVASAAVEAYNAHLEHDVSLLLRLSQPRGQDATGVAARAGRTFHVLKRPMPASAFVRTPEYRALLAGASGGSAGTTVLGLCRLATSGSVLVPRHNQPVKRATLVGVHNGVLAVNSSLDDQTDSEELFSSIESLVNAGASADQAATQAFATIEGSASIIFAMTSTRELVAATNTGSLFVGRDASRGIMVLASERAIVREFARATRVGQGPFTVEAIGAGTGLVINSATLATQRFAVPLSSPRPGRLRVPRPGPASDSAAADQPRLRRCTKCILTETHAFIDFDQDGVCNFCRASVRAPLRGEAALEAVLARHRSTDGSPDCIVAFSGGRDSSYALHLLKTRFRMNPIALTYDWGFVTDHGRRNQARLCGALGVEHVVRAAPIERKRQNVRANVLAWLHRPHLGMIPLFSAGDKHFYDHARRLRKETGIELVVACSHDLERTEFKSGFCGIHENDHRNVLYRFSWWSKLRLLLWFVGQYLANPRYVNRSALDTMLAYKAGFIARDDFFYIYHYLQWREDEVVDSLVRMYGWEPDPDSGVTWRNGDGYSAFTNYIYYRVAGFSEYDVLRSNQVRAGLIDRSEALRAAAHENEPRAELFDFADWIGLDLDWLLARINSIPPLMRHRVAQREQPLAATPRMPARGARSALRRAMLVPFSAALATLVLATLNAAGSWAPEVPPPSEYAGSLRTRGETTVFGEPNRDARHLADLPPGTMVSAGIRNGPWTSVNVDGQGTGFVLSADLRSPPRATAAARRPPFPPQGPNGPPLVVPPKIPPARLPDQGKAVVVPMNDRT